MAITEDEAKTGKHGPPLAAMPGLCGNFSPNGKFRCNRPAGHDAGPHMFWGWGWDGIVAEWPQSSKVAH
jgi:hypothetical protein